MYAIRSYYAISLTVAKRDEAALIEESTKDLLIA